MKRTVITVDGNGRLSIPSNLEEREFVMKPLKEILK
jgi:7,8-dihydro-6-hydroxymethylpterin-pyrophosphokinase